MSERFKIGDRVVLVEPIGVSGEIVAVRRRQNHLLSDRIYVKRDDGFKGTGPDGTWITNAYSIRKEHVEG